MLFNYLLIFTLICVLKTTGIYAVTSFNGAFTKDHEFILPSSDVTSERDIQITKYIEEFKEHRYFRHKRHLYEQIEYNGAGIGVLKDFEEIPEFTLPNASDVSFFIRQNEAELQWFVAALDSSGVSLIQLRSNSFVQIASYALINGTSITTDSLQSSTIIVIGKSDDSIIVLQLRQENEKYILDLAQHFDNPGLSHLTLWRGMNQLYLGVASRFNLSIYHWLGEHFDLIQILNFRAKKLTPFKTGGSMHLAVTGLQTLILRFLLQSNTFIVTQRLPAATNVITFYLKKGRLREHYLALPNEKSTILYKQMQGRFVPFQKIVTADRIYPLTTKKTILLLLLKDDNLKVYQYDGWRFVELGIKKSGINRIRLISEMYGDVLLAMRYRNGLWKLQKTSWLQEGTWNNLRDEVESWCFQATDKAKRILSSVPELKRPVHILKGHINKLKVHNINGKDTQGLVNLTRRYNEIKSKLSTAKEFVTRSLLTEGSKFGTLHATNIRVKCMSLCKADRIVTTEKYDFLNNLVRLENENQTLKFHNVKIKFTEGLQCPVPIVYLKEANVSGLLNGISLSVLYNDSLRVSGDQEITGHITFANLNVLNGLLPLEIATQTTWQKVHASSIKVKELNLTHGGILLPLNGTPTLISGTVFASKARIKKLVHTRGNIKGSGVKKIEPMTPVPGNLELFGDYTLQGVEITNTLLVNNLIRNKGKSLNEIMTNAVPLSANVPVHLILSKDKVTWSNVTLQSFPMWITTKYSDEIINVTAAKYTPHNLTLTNTTYKSLPIPKLQGELCSTVTTSYGIETPIVTFDRVTAKFVKSGHILGATNLHNTLTDSAILADNLELTSKNFLGNVKVNNTSLLSMMNVDLIGLWKSILMWTKPDFIKGLVKATDLVIHNCLMPMGFKMPSSLKVRNVVSKQNTYVVFINGINITDFVQNAVKLNEILSLTNVTFGSDLIVNKAYASHTPANLLLNVKANGSLGSKSIAGTLKTMGILSLPYVFTYPPFDTPTNLILKGSGTFTKEPTFENVNEWNLEKISNEIWMATRSTTLSNNFFEIKNLTLEGSVNVLESINTPGFGSWIEISNRLLSKTKPQEINVYTSFGNINVPNIIGSKTAVLETPISFLDGLESNSLKKNDTQIVTTSLRFEELRVLGNLELYGKINNMNLTTDTMRFDVKENIVTGKKTVVNIIAQNIDGLNFGDWSRNTLKTKNADKLVIIKGWKKFKTIDMQHLSVAGTVMDRKIDNLLLKSSMQEVGGFKTIRGTLKAPAIIIDGLINDVNLTSLAKHQLKKRKDVQRIKTRIILQNGLEVTGNVTIDGLYQGIRLNDFDKVNKSLEPVVRRMTELTDLAEGIDMALQNRAKYWNKLELLEDNPEPLILDTLSIKPIGFNGLGYCKMINGTLICDNKEMHVFISSNALNHILLNEVFSLKGLPFVVIATSDPNGRISIYSFDIVKKRFHQEVGLHLPGATQASAVATNECLWLVVQLSFNVMILRFEPWGEFQKYFLPGPGPFLMNVVPTNEILIFRFDGVWALGGLAEPHQIFQAPLNGMINSMTFHMDHYVQLMKDNVTTLSKTRYIGN